VPTVIDEVDRTPGLGTHLSPDTVCQTHLQQGVRFVPEVKLTAELRTEFGKGAARRIRRADKVPAVLYGHGTDPIHITLPGHETLLALRQANALLSIEVDGGAQLALPKQVQRDPIKHTIEHVDLLLVRLGEKVTVDIPVLIEGEAAPDTLVDVVANTVSVEAEATHIPQQISVSIEGLKAGTQILARDLQLPEGSSIQGDDEVLIVNITNAPTAAEVEAELAEAEAEAGIEPTIAEGTEDDAAEGEGAEASDES
jgi:large subunit ribosomal protein L25